MPHAQPPFRPTASYRYTVDDATIAVTLHEPTDPAPSVPEALVQDLWARQQFDASDLTTTDGQSVRVLDPGTLNTDSGADFTETHLRIGELSWHGDVEIHTTSGHWYDHEHHCDTRYNSVVLHVTLYEDEWTGGLLRENESPIPELVLYPHLERPLRTLLRDFYTRDDAPIPCAAQWAHVPQAIRRRWIQQLGRRRLMAKRDRLMERFAEQPDLEALLHERLFAGLGYAKNDAPMSTLARRLPLTLVRRWIDPVDLEALHFGIAGLLPEPADLIDTDRATADYAMELRRRFRRIQMEADGPPMDRERWSFFRLRPANFPPLRIAQGVAMIGPGGLLRHDPIGSLIAATEQDHPLSALRTLLRAQPSDFWTNHVRLEKSSASRNPQIGRSRIDTLIVNAVLPVLLLYADRHDRPGLAERVVTTLETLPAPRDSVTRIFGDLGTRPQSALESQGMHRLYRSFCTEGGCLTCDIGTYLLDSDTRERTGE